MLYVRRRSEKNEQYFQEYFRTRDGEERKIRTPQNSQESTEGNTQETLAAEAIPARKSRATARFAKQKILAPRDLFLNPTCRGCFTDSIVEIAGKIEECPRAVNNHRYRIDWRKNNGQPLPAGLPPEYFQEYFPNTSESNSPYAQQFPSCGSLMKRSCRVSIFTKGQPRYTASAFRTTTAPSLLLVFQKFVRAQSTST